MRRKIIFLDMDGVLANFHKGVFDLFTTDFNKFLLDQKKLPLEYAIHKWLKIDETFMWSVIEDKPNFWLDLEPFPWLETLYKSLINEKHWIIISTHPSLDLNAHSQKMKWIQNHLPWHNLDDVMIGKRKHLLAKQGRVLIDDYNGNCQAFKLAGGTSILFPQPWNKNHLTVKRLEYIAEMLELTPEPKEET